MVASYLGAEEISKSTGESNLKHSAALRAPTLPMPCPCSIKVPIKVERVEVNVENNADIGG